jgi:DHA1 family bicyclomycin/chloramphenicol resistance-like MFS transporter
MQKTSARPDVGGSMPSFREFVALMALLMALTAMGIDVLLPALPAIGADLGVEDGNSLQLLVYVYMFGFAAVQLVYGPLSDAIGRRGVLLAGIVIYLAGCALAAVAPDFTTLVVARLIQGVGAASSRVLTVSIVRDRFGGRDMAQVMSIIMMVFILVPVIAPAIGGAIIAVGDWHHVFVSMFALGAVAGAWYALRMPETMHPEYRLPLSPARLAAAATTCLTQRTTIGYATAMGLLQACLMGYIGQSQQVFEGEVFGLGAWFPLAFGLLALAIGIGSMANALLVRRIGMRRLTHAAVLAATAAAGLMLAVTLLADGDPSLWVFGPTLAVFNLAFALAMPNCSAMAMEPLGAVAGTASSLIGFYTTMMSAVLGLAIGQSFDGTVLPLSIGFLVLCSAAVVAVTWTERGRLFRPATTTRP